VSRRVRVPAADELFRATAPLAPVTADGDAAGAAGAAGVTSGGRDRLRAVPDVDTPGVDGRARGAGASGRGRARHTTGREQHREKITVYVSAEELLDLEQARLTLRATCGLAVDRGRLVREAVAAVLEEFDALGEDSTLVRRLRRA
jgi:hypothetical protein